jgi:hypothetical protein
MDGLRTWDQVRDAWFDGMEEYQELMHTGLRETANAELSECSFSRNGRWLIATAKDGSQWVWDDTTGEWSAKGELDEDD